MLRNLVQSLIEHESIKTTYPRAKEAQKMADNLINLAKKNTNASKNEALKYLYVHQLNEKLFGTIRERYANRNGGFTRVLHIEPYNNDAAPSAILELVDGSKDMRFAMTAKAVARNIYERTELHPMTLQNVEKVTRFRTDGKEEFRKVVNYFVDALEKKHGRTEGLPQGDKAPAIEEDIIPRKDIGSEPAIPPS
ncbi:54S ribosomal protein L8 [Drechslerella dactyloides]|uniref:54S ribosomal protein L8 n=1 Tax=Drechslerella dactyloides TaxID=74499 RepID=A0AAD6J5T4_DREDA|nr:54S ribosomal protein L8 [Drechslerella dactyloides]